ncbi:MAG: hypothetical protein M3164_02745 [Actinomycetota bacterium]|nr:hypothetical protein [Actinomycetota bacterium]
MEREASEARRGKDDMKLLILAFVVALVCVVLFVAGFLSPPRSRRMQKKADGLSRKAEGKGEEKAGRFGNAAGSAFKRSRHAADRSAEKGRQLHDRVWPN